jgi:hypothetical protein
MRFDLRFGLVGVIVAVGVIPGQARASDPADLRQKLTDLEGRIAALQREAVELRHQLDKLAPPKLAAVGPHEAIEAYRKNPNQPVTVEFGVEAGSGACRTGLGPGADAIIATWDGRFPGGGTLTAILHPSAYVGLKIPSKEIGREAVTPPLGDERAAIGRHIDEHGLRVTGVIRQGEGFPRVPSYYIEVDDPAKVVLYISVAPRPVRQR